MPVVVVALLTEATLLEPGVRGVEVTAVIQDLLLQLLVVQILAGAVAVLTVYQMARPVQAVPVS
jgi:hypothetical protein